LAGKIMPGSWGLGAANNYLDTLGEAAARHQHLASAGQTNRADISAQADDAPFVAPARVGLAHPHYVVQADVGGVNHSGF
jgi:hypothetical protein